MLPDISITSFDLLSFSILVLISCLVSGTILYLLRKWLYWFFAFIAAIGIIFAVADDVQLDLRFNLKSRFTIAVGAGLVFIFIIALVWWHFPPSSGLSE